jgi:adenosylcobinamide-GDP ribazoletransferase
VHYFSRLPVLKKNVPENLHFNKSIRYITWVGLIVSTVSAVIMYYFSQLLPISVVVVIGLTVNILLTGAFHEDGLADVCDGFGGGYNKQRILDIMKDSHIGTYGVIGLIMAFLFRYTALAEMPKFFLAVFFILGNTISRFTLITVMMQHSYVRDNETSKSKTVIGKIDFNDLFIGSIPVIALFIFIGSISLLLVIIPVGIANWLLTGYFKRKIDGYTGDCLGAMQQTTEIVFYLAALVWLKFTW